MTKSAFLEVQECIAVTLFRLMKNPAASGLRAEGLLATTLRP
jgi:hypothetical protein